MNNERMAYLNGEFLPMHKASVSPLDRGFLLGDGIYEVVPVYYKKLFRLREHIERLNQCLKSIRMEPCLSLEDWRNLSNILIEKNQDEHQWIYWQVTRGADATRGHAIPPNLSPTIFATSFPNTLPEKQALAKGVKTIGVEDIRWKFCDIKNISRLAYVLMHQKAVDAGCGEAIIFNNGSAIECSISNLFIVKEGVIITPPKSHLLLSGITRDCILKLAEKNKIPYRETEISENDLLKADEVWITSSTRGVHPVVEFNGQAIGQGKAGPLWSTMWDLFLAEIGQTE